MQSRFHAVIFDVDGTLIDSNDAHARAWVEALREAGHAVAYERVRWLIGKGGDKLLPEVAGIDSDSAEGDRIKRRRGEIFLNRDLPHLRPFDGADHLLQLLHERGAQMVVASSAEERELHALLERVPGHELLRQRTSSDDVARSKPDPDIVSAALKRVGEKPDRAVMIGDTPYDVEAARRAGVSTIAFRCGGWRDADLTGALAVYDGPWQLVARFDDSPLAGEREPQRSSR